MSAISIPKGPIKLAGLLFKSSSTLSKSPAIIVVHPGGGVKEQAASLYASKLAEKGFTTVCFDAAHQGESGGSPHFLEDPNWRVSDIWAVLDYVQELDSVDRAKICIVGVCAGGGYAVAAAKADYRLKAVATVSMVNIGESARLGWNGDENPRKHVKSLEALAAQLSEEKSGVENATTVYVPPLDTIDENTPQDMKEASEYYLTPRAQHPRAENKMLVRSTGLVMNFDAFHLADIFLTQPVLVIAGEKAGSKWQSEKLIQKLKGKENLKKLFLEGGTHMDFYDKPKYVDPAVKVIEAFMKESLASV